MDSYRPEQRDSAGKFTRERSFQRRNSNGRRSTQFKDSSSRASHDKENRYNRDYRGVPRSRSRSPTNDGGRMTGRRESGESSSAWNSDDFRQREKGYSSKNGHRNHNVWGRSEHDSSWPPDSGSGNARYSRNTQQKADRGNMNDDQISRDHIQDRRPKNKGRKHQIYTAEFARKHNLKSESSLDSNRITSMASTGDDSERVQSFAGEEAAGIFKPRDSTSINQSDCYQSSNQGPVGIFEVYPRKSTPNTPLGAKELIGTERVGIFGRYPPTARGFNDKNAAEETLHISGSAWTTARGGADRQWVGQEKEQRDGIFGQDRRAPVRVNHYTKSPVLHTTHQNVAFNNDLVLSDWFDIQDVVTTNDPTGIPMVPGNNMIPQQLNGNDSTRGNLDTTGREFSSGEDTNTSRGWPRRSFVSIPRPNAVSEIEVHCPKDNTIHPKGLDIAQQEAPIDLKNRARTTNTRNPTCWDGIKEYMAHIGQDRQVSVSEVAAFDLLTRRTHQKTYPAPSMSTIRQVLGIFEQRPGFLILDPAWATREISNRALDERIGDKGTHTYGFILQRDGEHTFNVLDVSKRKAFCYGTIDSTHRMEVPLQLIIGKYASRIGVPWSMRNVLCDNGKSSSLYAMMSMLFWWRGYDSWQSPESHAAIRYYLACLLCTADKGEEPLIHQLLQEFRQENRGDVEMDALISVMAEDGLRRGQRLEATRGKVSTTGHRKDTVGSIEKLVLAMDMERNDDIDSTGEDLASPGEREEQVDEEDMDEVALIETGASHDREIPCSSSQHTPLCTPETQK
ncbi:hypothetical protein ONS96_005279 [Cadophora gregata f. sp. sojae]|nr:hypothetical protein ONS96_005279 [Cadophora gregata f. sp. sojae]